MDEIGKANGANPALAEPVAAIRQVLQDPALDPKVRAENLVRQIVAMKFSTPETEARAADKLRLLPPIIKELRIKNAWTDVIREMEKTFIDLRSLAVPPVAQPQTEIERVMQAMCEAGWDQRELEQLGRELEPGEKILTHTALDVITSGRTLDRAGLRARARPAYWTDLGGWDRQFPKLPPREAGREPA